MMTLLCALCLTLAAAAPQAQAPLAREGDAYLLRVSEDPRDPFDLFELVTLCQEATGVNFACDAETAQELRATPVVLLGPKRIPKRELHDFDSSPYWPP